MDVIEGQDKKRIKIPIILVIILVLLILAIISNFIFDFGGTEANEYTGEKDLSYIEKALSDSEYYIFNDNGKKYIAFTMTEEAYGNAIKIDSVRIYNKKYSDTNILSLDVSLNTTSYNDPNSTKIRNTDTILIVQEVEENCSGLIVNDKEYKLFSGGIVEDSSGYGYVNQDGDIVIPTEYTSIDKIKLEYFSEETGEITTYSATSDYLLIYKEGIGYGIATTSGNILVECQYQTIINFGEDTFAVTRGDVNNAEIGIINVYGNVVIDFVSGGIFNQSKKFEKYVIVSLNDKMGVLNRNLETVIPIEYDYIAMTEYEEKIYFALEQNGQYQLISETGENAAISSAQSIIQMFGNDIGEEEIEEIYNSILDSGLINY